MTTISDVLDLSTSMIIPICKSQRLISVSSVVLILVFYQIWESLVDVFS